MVSIITHITTAQTNHVEVHIYSFLKLDLCIIPVTATTGLAGLETTNRNVSNASAPALPSIP